MFDFGGEAFLEVGAFVLLEIVCQETETCHGWFFFCQRLPFDPGMRHLQAIIATEALESEMKGTTVYGRRTTLAMENPSKAMEGEISGNRNKRRAHVLVCKQHSNRRPLRR